MIPYWNCRLQYRCLEKDAGYSLARPGQRYLRRLSACPIRSCACSAAWHAVTAHIYSAGRDVYCQSFAGSVLDLPWQEQEGALTMNVSPEKRRSWQRSVYAARLTGRVGRAIDLTKADRKSVV